jgi:hypothetical protein
LNLDRLGRSHLNRCRGQRRQHALTPVRYGSFHFNLDRRVGAMLFRIFGAHPRQEFRSVQRFIDAFGRGPWLHRLAMASSLFRYTHPTSSLQLHVPQMNFPIQGPPPHDVVRMQGKSNAGGIPCQ